MDAARNNLDLALEPFLVVIMDRVGSYCKTQNSCKNMSASLSHASGLSVDEIYHENAKDSLLALEKKEKCLMHGALSMKG